MNYWRRYVTHNPMRAETRRSFRRFFGMGKLGRKSVRGGMLIFGAIYLMILLILIYEALDIPPSLAVDLEIVVLLMVACIGFYSAISGERERRTWDVLRVAPVTRGQIVVGKFLSGASVIGIVALLFLPFNLLCGFVTVHHGYNTPFTTYVVNGASENVLAVIQVVMSSLVAVMAGLIALAITLLFSARCKSSLSALSVSLGVLFFWVALIPMFASMAYPYPDNDQFRLRLSMNPFGFNHQIEEALERHGGVRQPFAFVGLLLMFVLFTLALSVGLMIWTEKTLTFAEDKVDFIAKKNDA